MRRYGKQYQADEQLCISKLLLWRKLCLLTFIFKTYWEIACVVWYKRFLWRTPALAARMCFCLKTWRMFFCLYSSNKLVCISLEAEGEALRAFLKQPQAFSSLYSGSCSLFPLLENEDKKLVLVTPMRWIRQKKNIWPLFCYYC